MTRRIDPRPTADIAGAPRRVLVGIDGSAASANAARAALRLVAPDGAVCLAHVVSTSALRRLSDWVCGAGLTGAARALRARGAERDLGRFAAAVQRETRARVEHVVVTGDVAGELRRLSAEREADLLVIGAARPLRLARRLLDGVAVRLAEGVVPTLVVPEGTAPGRALLVAPRRTPLEPEARWLLDRASSPVLLLPPHGRARTDPMAALAAWHGDDVGSIERSVSAGARTARPWRCA